MARPRKLGLSYFPHDVDSADDPKVSALRAKFGNDGYAFFFIMLEQAYKTEAGRLHSHADSASPASAVIQDELFRSYHAHKCGITPEKWDLILTYAVSIGLFDEAAWNDHKQLTSVGIQERLGAVADERERKRKENKQQTKLNASGVKTGENSGVIPEKPRNNPGITPEAPPLGVVGGGEEFFPAPEFACPRMRTLSTAGGLWTMLCDGIASPPDRVRIAGDIEAALAGNAIKAPDAYARKVLSAKVRDWRAANIPPARPTPEEIAKREAEAEAAWQRTKAKHTAPVVLGKCEACGAEMKTAGARCPGCAHRAKFSALRGKMTPVEERKEIQP